MDWHKQTHDTLNAWMSAQKQMADTWNATLKGMIEANRSAAYDISSEKATQRGFMSSEQTSHAEETPWAALQAELLQAWTKAAGAMASSVLPNIGQVVDKLFGSQVGVAALLQQLALGWQALSPIMEGGGDWESALRSHVAKVRDELRQSAAAMGKTSAGMSQLVSTYLEQWQRTSALFATKAPGLGFGQELDEDIKQGVALWLKMQQAASEYQTILVEIWADSLEQMLRDLVARAQAGEDVSNVRALLDQWSAIADKAFQGAYDEARYVKAQGELVNASMRFRIAARALAERCLKAVDMPTRVEVDEAHRRIYELGKELKALKQELAQVKSGKGG